MAKTIKISKNQISNMINEEVKRFEKIKLLENKRAEIAKTLLEMYEMEELMEMGIDEGIFGNIGKSISKAFYLMQVTALVMVMLLFQAQSQLTECQH